MTVGVCTGPCGRCTERRNQRRAWGLSCYEQGYKDGRNHHKRQRQPCEQYTIGIEHGRADGHVSRGGPRL